MDRGNTAEEGGAITSSLNSFLHVSSSVFLQNKASEDGGAFGSSASSVGFKNCSFLKNHARESGGAIATGVFYSVILNIFQCTFE